MGFLLPAIGAVAGIAGAVTSSNANNRAQRRAGAQIEDAVNELTGSKNDLLGSDSYKLFQSLVGNLAADPFTYSPERIAQMKATAIGSAQEASRGVQDDLLTRAGALGAGRDSSTYGGLEREGLKLGKTVADINRGIDVDAARQRLADIAGLGSILQGLFNLRSAPSQAIASARLGAAPTIAGFNASPFGDALKGIGTIGTTWGSADLSGDTLLSRLLGGGGGDGGYDPLLAPSVFG